MKVFFKYWFPVIVYAILIFVFSSIPGSALPKSLIGWDYFLHIIEYLPFGFLVCRALTKSKKDFSSQKALIFSFLLAILYAASDELHQLFVPGRYFSFFDFLYDGVGAAIGVRFAT